MKGSTEARTPKFKLFNCLSETYQIFRIGKYEKIKFDKIGGIKTKGFSSNKDAKIQTLNTYAGLMKFSE